MKRMIALLLALVLAVLCAGCGSDTAGKQEVTAAVTEAKAPSAYDLDLSKMSSTMIYSEVSNIMTTPESYIGKTFRIKGTFQQNQGYYFVLINDATACCAQGIEFIWAGDHKYPDDYPEIDTEIIVAGTFESYMEGEKKYYHINNATLETA